MKTTNVKVKKPFNINGVRYDVGMRDVPTSSIPNLVLQDKIEAPETKEPANKSTASVPTPPVTSTTDTQDK